MPRKRSFSASRRSFIALEDGLAPLAALVRRLQPYFPTSIGRLVESRARMDITSLVRRLAPAIRDPALGAKGLDRHGSRSYKSGGVQEKKQGRHQFPSPSAEIDG